MPFRWDLKHDLALCIEVVKSRPHKPAQWDAIAEILNEQFSLSLKGRGCRDRLLLVLLKKYKANDARALKRSGTEEEYSELEQLLEDIKSYNEGFDLGVKQENEKKLTKKEEDKRKGEEMRRAAMLSFSEQAKDLDPLQDSSSTSSDDSCIVLSPAAATCTSGDENKTPDSQQPPKKRKSSSSTESAGKRRLTYSSTAELFREKFEKRAELKEKELEIRRMELMMQQKRLEMEEKERRVRLELDAEERRAFIQFIQKSI